VAALAFGSWPLVGVHLGRIAAVLIPQALGLPSLYPQLRATPLGGTTWFLWFVETLGALVMLGAFWWSTRRPTRRPALRAWWATVVAVVAGNIVRLVGTTLVSQPDLRTYVAAVVVEVLLSLILGALLGLLVAPVVAVAGRALRKGS
jgi:hypothetical protein